MKLNFTFFNFYALFIILSLLVGILVFDIYLNKWKIDKIHIIILNFLFLILIPFFAMLLTVLENLIYKHKFIIGLSSYGGLIGMILALYIFCKIFKYNAKLFSKILFIIVPLMYSISKIGCFLVGCCYGIVYNGIGSIVYISSNRAPLNIKLFPIQLLESITFLIIFIYLINKYKKDKKNIVAFSLILCGFAKFCLEFLRASWKNTISFTQIISLIFIFIGIFLILRSKKSGRLYKSY